MKAIQTRYYGPTNYQGSRIIARAEGVPSLSLPYPYELSVDDAHAKAATLLATKQRWLTPSSPFRLVSGVLPNGDHAHCFTA
jgi:hypothetical protein